MEDCENVRRQQEKLIAALQMQLNTVYSQLERKEIDLEALEAEVAAVKTNFESQKQQMHQNQVYLQNCEAQMKNPTAIESIETHTNPECIPQDASAFMAESFASINPSDHKFSFQGKIVPMDWTKHPTKLADVFANCGIQIIITCEAGETFNFLGHNCSHVIFDKDGKTIGMEFGGSCQQPWKIEGKLSVNAKKPNGYREFQFIALLKREDMTKGKDKYERLWTGSSSMLVTECKGKMEPIRPYVTTFPNEIIHCNVTSEGYTNYAQVPDANAQMFVTECKEFKPKNK